MTQSKAAQVAAWEAARTVFVVDYADSPTVPISIASQRRAGV
jgi:hypothetical protein